MEKIWEQKSAGSLFGGRTFEVDKKNPESYEYWVNETAKLIKRPYFVTHKLVGDWPIEKIIERYNDALKVEGMPQDIWWFWKRKQEKET